MGEIKKYPFKSIITHFLNWGKFDLSPKCVWSAVFQIGRFNAGFMERLLRVYSRRKRLLICQVNH